MSFQPQVPVMGLQPPPPVDEPPAKGKRRKGLIVLGLILLLGGVLGGGAMVAKSMSNYETSVKALARAPVGCTTTLVFDKPATFTLYAETKGKLGKLSGDCEANGTDYNHAGDKLPKVSMTLVDSKGTEVDLQRGATATYDAAGYVGTALRTMKIQQAGTYRLNVESDETDFAVAIGKNPKKDSDLLKTIGGAVALAGFVLGLLFFLLGLRRRRPDFAAVSDGRSPVAPMPGWPPGPYGPAPTAPPGHPGFGVQPPPPQPVGVPGQQPPVRLPGQVPGGGFAPPSLAPPSAPPYAVPPSPPMPPGPPPSAPPTVAPPSPPPPPPPPGIGWTVPDSDDDERT